MVVSFNKIKRKIYLILDIPRQILIYLIWRYKRYDLKDSLVIFSEARGGSTWLMEILSNIPNSCLNWEPLHVAKGIVPKKLRFGSRPFIPTRDKSETYLNLFKRIISFSISTKWSRKYLSISKILSSKFVITKFTRANLLVPYIIKNLKFDKKPIFLIRHPVDTCLSAINTFKTKSWVGNYDEIPDVINNDRYHENIDFLSCLESQIEVCIANWCLNNVSTLNNVELMNKMSVIFYYDLILDPSIQIKKISNDLKLSEYEKNKLLSVDFRKPSSTSVTGQLKNTPKEQLNKNFNRLSLDDKDRIQMIFDYFDFKLFDAYSPEPKII